MLGYFPNLPYHVVVVGAASGIGRETATFLATQGVSVACIDRNPTGAEETAAARARGPRWREDHERLAVALSRGGDWAGAEAEYRKLAAAFPAEATYPYYVGLALAARGDGQGAARWIRTAAALPTADGEVRAAARALEPGREGAVPR